MTSGYGKQTQPAGATHSIMEECERLFCGTLRAVFLGEGKTSSQRPVMIDAGSMSASSLIRFSVEHDMAFISSISECSSSLDPNNVQARRISTSETISTPSSSVSGSSPVANSRLAPLMWPYRGIVTRWLEIHDYTSGASFRGFTTANPTKHGCETLVVFFDASVFDKDLKQGYVRES